MRSTPGTGRFKLNQYRHTQVPDYEDRHTETLDEVEPDWYYGWRQPAELTDEELELFTQYLFTMGVRNETAYKLPSRRD